MTGIRLHVVFIVVNSFRYNKLLLHGLICCTLLRMCNSKFFHPAIDRPAEVSKALGFSSQRVCNWKKRGIPPRVLLDYREVLDRIAGGEPVLDGSSVADPPAKEQESTGNHGCG